MLEAELGFVDELEDVMSFVEVSTKAVIERLMSAKAVGGAREEMDYFAETWGKFGGHPSEAVPSNLTPRPPLLDTLSSLSSSSKPWARISYVDAIRELSSYDQDTSRKVFKHRPVYGQGLQSEHEKWLSGTLVGGPVFVTDYPRQIKPFYMKLNSASSRTSPTAETGSPDEGDTVACFDLLIPRIGELMGGSLRENSEDLLLSSLRLSGIPPETLEWYTDLRKFGSAPHGGFGMGFERFMCFLTGWENVRDVVPFPRVAGRILL